MISLDSEKNSHFLSPIIGKSSKNGDHNIDPGLTTLYRMLLPQISAEVQSIYSDGAVSLHTRSLKYGKLAQGTLVKARHFNYYLIK
jgi:hypothetical protein